MAKHTPSAQPEILNGEIPLDWSVVQLGNVGQVRYGLGQPPEQDENGVPMLRATNVKRGRIAKEGLIRIKREAIPESRNPYLKEGDIIVVRSGAYTGDVAMVTPEWAGSVAGYDLIYSPSQKIDPSFCAFNLLGGSVQAYFRSQRDRSAQPHLNRQQLEDAKVLLPPLEEQQSIAHVLRTVQRAKEATEKVIAAARQLKQSLMRHLFTYGPVPVEEADQVPLKETEIGPVPEQWQVVKVEAVADLVSGGTPSKARPEFWQGTIPWVSPKDMKRPRLFDVEDHISQEGAEDGSRIVPSGSLFIVIRGMILAKDLPVALAMVPMAFNQDMKAILPKPDLNAEYLLYCFNHHKQRMMPEIGTSAHGTKRIGTSAITDFQIPLPPMEEQKEIASMLASVDKKIEVESAKANALDILFQSKLHHLMTGKVRVNELAFPAMKEGSP